MDKRLSKKFIAFQKQRLEKDKEKSLKQVEELKKDDPFADPDHASDNAAVDTDVREQVGHETIEAEIKDLGKRLLAIDIALKRIMKGSSYGICERCHKAIPIPRLKLIPEAEYCIDCERKLRK